MSKPEYLTRHIETLEKNLKHYNVAVNNVFIDVSKTNMFVDKNKLPDGSKLTACYTRDRDADARQRLRVKLQRQQKSKNH